MQEQNYEDRFELALEYTSPNGSRRMSVLNLSLKTANFDDDSKKVENSVEIVHCFDQIKVLFQKYLKELTSDFLCRHQDDYLPMPPEPNAWYVFILTDLQYPTANGNTIVKEIYHCYVSAKEFIYNQNYPLSILPIWKDFESEGATQKGIRSHLKDALSKTRYQNRFKKSAANQFVNTNNIFSSNIAYNKTKKWKTISPIV